MELTLRPETARFIHDQIQTGRFPTPEAVVEAAIAELQQSTDVELDADAIEAINRADAQADRGEGTELDAFRAEFRRQTGTR